MPGYLYRRSGTGRDPWNSQRQGGTPPDAGPAPPIAPALPHRRTPPLRACAAAFVLLLARPPMDAGTAANPWPVSDSFTGAPGTLLSAHAPDSGGAWTLHPSYVGTAQIDAANRLRQTATGATCYYVDAPPTSADYDVSATAVELTSAAGVSTTGVVGRLVQASNTYYTARLEINGSVWALYKSVSSTETILASSSAPAVTLGQSYQLTLRMVGSTIQLLVDGIVRATATDSAISAAGRAGVRFTSVSSSPSDTALIHLDAFAANDIPGPPIAAEYLDPVQGRRRAASSAYAIAAPPAPEVVGFVGDRGGRPKARYLYRRAVEPGPYALIVRSPMDSGVVANDPPIAAEAPDLARGARRAASSAYAIATGTPGDAGAVVVAPSIVPEAPDLARGRARASGAAYAILVKPPPDAGVVFVAAPVAPEYPDSAPGRRRPAATSYAALASATPRDLGAIPGPIRPQYPDRAPGRRRTSSGAYLVALLPPADAGVIAGFHVYANTGIGDPINYASPIASTTLLTWTSGTLAHPGDWKFGVRAYDGISGQEERNVDAAVRLKLDAAGNDVTAMPDAPSDLSGVPRAAGAIALDWAYSLVDPARAPTGFHVYRGTGGTPSYASAVATAAYTRGLVHFTATVAGGADGVAYTFGIRAFNATGEETNVMTTTVTAKAAGPAPITGLTGTATT